MKIAFEFWVSFGIFRLIGNKRDVVRERIVLKEYFEYEKQILEKTQNEVYNEFRVKFFDVKMG